MKLCCTGAMNFLNLKSLPFFGNLIVILGGLTIVFNLTACRGGKSEEISDANLVMQYSDKELSQIYCAMCHIYAGPELLDKDTWINSVLPNMGMRLGIKDSSTDPFKDLSPEDVKIVKDLNIYPGVPLIKPADWKRIVKYYLKMAPSELPHMGKRPQTNNDLMPFEPSFIQIGESLLPQVTLLKFDRFNSLLYVGDFEKVYALSNSGELRNAWKIPSPIVHMEFHPKLPPLSLGIGTFSPSDRQKGVLTYLIPPKQIPNINLDSLKRPVHFITADLNMDGKNDVLISQFGNYRGKLSWYDGMDPEKENILSFLPGSRVAYVQDMNGDNMPDVVALLSQAREQVVVFYNRGDGKFEEETLIEFPPVYGVSFLDFVDFNSDGHKDLLVSNGDNWDLSNINKYYHGFRIYMNDGNNHFEETFFYPMYGCSKAMARDFDQDGDLDIVANSFYATLDNPTESFVYLQNDGKNNFVQSFIPEAGNGKWLTMEVADFNKDGRDDVLLGSFIFNITELGKAVTETGQTEFPSVLLLINKFEKE